MSNYRLTVDAVRALIEDLPGDTPIGVEWETGHVPVNDNEPAVRVFGFRREGFAGIPVIKVLVGLQYLDDLPDHRRRDDPCLSHVLRSDHEQSVSPCRRQAGWYR